MQNLESQFTFKLKQKSSSFSTKCGVDCKILTSEFQQFLSLQYFVDTFYWSDGVGVCLGQVYCNSNIQPLGPPSQLFMQILCWCADTGRFEQCTIRLEWFNKYHLISQ